MQAPYETASGSSSSRTPSGSAHPGPGHRPGQDGALGVLVQMVDVHPGRGRPTAEHPAVLGDHRRGGGVQHQDLHLDAELPCAVSRFVEQAEQGGGAGAVGGQGQADAAHWSAPGTAAASGAAPADRSAGSCQELRPSSLLPSSVSSAVG